MTLGDILIDNFTSYPTAQEFFSKSSEYFNHTALILSMPLNVSEALELSNRINDRNVTVEDTFLMLSLLRRHLNDSTEHFPLLSDRHISGALLVSFYWVFQIMINNLFCSVLQPLISSNLSLSFLSDKLRFYEANFTSFNASDLHELSQNLHHNKTLESLTNNMQIPDQVSVQLVDYHKLSKLLNVTNATGESMRDILIDLAQDVSPMQSK